MTLFEVDIIMLALPFFILFRWWCWCSIHLATHLFFWTLFLADLILYCESYIPTILLETNSKEIRKWMTQSAFFSELFFKLRTESLCFILLLFYFFFYCFCFFFLFLMNVFLDDSLLRIYKNKEITMRIFLFLNTL